MKRFIMTYLMLMLCMLTMTAQQEQDTHLQSTDSTATEEHVVLLDTPLSATPQTLVEAMKSHGIRYNYLDSLRHTHHLHGTLSGMEIAIEVRGNKDMTKTDLVKFATQQNRNQQEDFERMQHWLQKEYDQPDWKGTVRSHRFCRWFADFDRDIVLIATGSGTVEVWFYDNHQQRNIDYYSILKYCERNPAENVPTLTAQESVTWKSDSTIKVRRHVATRHKRHVGRRHKVVRRRAVHRKSVHRKSNRRRRR